MPLAHKVENIILEKNVDLYAGWVGHVISLNQRITGIVEAVELWDVSERNPQLRVTFRGGKSVLLYVGADTQVLLSEEVY